MEADQRELMHGLVPLPPPRRHDMYSTVMMAILLFPWCLLGVMMVGTLGQRLRKVPIRSR